MSLLIPVHGVRVTHASTQRRLFSANIMSLGTFVLLSVVLIDQIPSELTGNFKDSGHEDSV